MTRWLRRLIPVGIVVVVLVWQPLWVLVALLVPGLVIVEAAAAVASLVMAGPIDTGVHVSVPLLADFALSLASLVAIVFWATTCLVLLALRLRKR